MPFPWIAGTLAIGGLWAGLMIICHLDGRSTPLDRVEAILLDTRIALIGRRAAPDTVAIVAIDDATLLEVGRYPLDRRKLAELIDAIARAGAHAVAIDMLFLGPTDAQADAALATSLGRLPTVIAGAARFGSTGDHVARVPLTREILRPLPLLERQAALGLVNVMTDAGGTPRQIPMIYQTTGMPEASLVLRATGLRLGGMPLMSENGLTIGQGTIPLDLGWHLTLNYYGPGGTIRTVSAADLLKAGNAGRALEGRLVVLGVTATGLGDRFTTPFDQVMPGVEVLGTGISNLLDGSALRRDHFVRRVDAAIATLVALIAVAAMISLPLAAGAFIYLSILLSWFAIATLAFDQFYWLNGALPLAASLPPAASAAVLRQLFDRYRMQRLASAQAALGKFQSATLARHIAEDPSFLLEPREQMAAILFVDLVGFTSLSERIGPRQTRDMLKAFHTLVVDECERHHGLVMDFMGDGVMIGFGIPDNAANDAGNAVSSAFSLLQTINDWLLSAGFAQTSAVRVGGHCGTVTLSRLGHDEHQQIAATGACVNVASRLVDVGRSRNAALVLSRDLLQQAGLHEQVKSEGHGFEAVKIRGRDKPVDVIAWTAAEVPLDF